MVKISPQESSRRRRIVFATCMGVLSEQESLSVVRLCDQQFGGAERLLPFRLFRAAQMILNFSPDVSRTLVRRFNEKELLPSTALGPDPVEANGNLSAPSEQPYNDGNTIAINEPVPIAIKRHKAAAPQTLSTVEKTARDIVFEFVIGKLLSRLNAGNRPEIQKYLLDSVGQADLNAQTRVMLSGWIKGDMNATSDMTPVRPEDMSLVFDLIYSWYCEIFGPVRTDKTIAEIINQAEALLPEAAEFSPRRLL